MSLTRKLKQALLPFGIEIHRRRPYGADIHRDIRNILGSQPGLTVFDVGANVGQTALGFAEEFPSATIHSFEPNPESFKALSRTVSNQNRVHPHRIALGSQSGKAQMHLTQSSLTSSMLRTSKTAGNFLGQLVENAGEVEVAVSCVDDFLAEHQISHLDLLKLDVQGFELDVLRGAKATLQNNRISLIMSEVNFVSLYEQQAFFHDIYLELTKNDFQLVGLYHGDYRDGAFLAWCDALFVNPTAIKTRQSSSTR